MIEGKGNPFRERGELGYAREKSRVQGYALIMNPEVRERSLRLGFLNEDLDETLKILSKKILPRDEMGVILSDHLDHEQTAESVVRNIDLLLRQIQARVVEPQKGLREALFFVHATFPLLSTEKAFHSMFRRYLSILKQSNPTGTWRFSGRILGLHFDEYRPHMTPEASADLQERLRHGYPLGMLPSIPLRDWTTAEREQFDLDHAVEDGTAELVSAPVSKEFVGSSVETSTSSVCSYAEEYFLSAVSNGVIDYLTSHGTLIGITKKAGEYTFLATKTIVNDERASLLRGGIYDVFEAEAVNKNRDPKRSVSDTSEYRVLSFVPLRLWEKEREDGSSGAPMDPIALELVIRRAQKAFEAQHRD